MEKHREFLRKPDWLKIRLNTNQDFRGIRTLVRQERLHTVCEEAKCPNIHECWASRRTATFMILGDICTRGCRFCAVKTGRPTELDLREPERVADSVKRMKLRHVVITAVARDDLNDGGAGVFAETVRAIRRKVPYCTIEVLPSDMKGDDASIETLMDAKPDIFDHNVETVRRLTKRVRAIATYDRSLAVLRRVKELSPNTPTKSSIMLGLGETKEEILQVMDDLLANHVDIMVIGQYLQPTRKHLDVVRYYSPEEFNELREIALSKGFRHCVSGPLARTSYHADEQVGEESRRRHDRLIAEEEESGQ
ncbi:lipoyl synthase [Sporolactobacillus sp. Y61]|jgi:lipoic acid synthetase|uniref:Lipoyl synthase n=1 Tax=Sporolactobacillus sp. Y61 TaxID=3160863 RepID=A0AAU8IC31_9BACL|nr:lipoyl synthase [Sporolactobacillus sp. THM19-2]RYL93560.1 lipoyl synthase [Sporolactobacillus sp. THM19-2]